jgi:hypothetical protein
MEPAVSAGRTAADRRLQNVKDTINEMNVE